MSENDLDLCFSVSATSRSPRPGEKDGVNYYFLTEEDFRKRIADGDFVEYEEVYPGRFYGTLKEEVEKKCSAGHNVILDIDVKGGVNVKNMFGDRATSIFIMPPSVQALRERLEGRGTDAPEVIDERVGRAEFELSFAPRYEYVVVNDNLAEAVAETHRVMKSFITGA